MTWRVLGNRLLRRHSIDHKSAKFSSKMSLHTNKPIVAVCQMTSTEDKPKNFECCQNLVKLAKQQNASMVFLPEGCDFICENAADVIKNAETENGPLISRYQNLARDNDVWLSLGGIHIKHSSEKTYNAHLIINNDGQIVRRYHKIHTFDVKLSNRSMCESSYVEKGDSIVPPVQTPLGNVGLAVCYDIRFPEIGIALTEMGADILTYPSCFMFETGSAHWEPLLRSRAIENQCYVIAAAQTGYNAPTKRAWGHAMIVDPTGTISAQCSEGEGIALSTINLDLIKNVRSSMPLMVQKRFDVYPQMAAAPLENVDSYQFGQVKLNSKVVFYRNDLTMAFVNKRCAVPGHVLVSPIRVALRLSDLSSVEVADLFRTVQKVQTVMEKIHDTKSSTIAVQDGPDAGQTIWHVHVHILPRKPNDFPDNDDVYRVLQKHDKTDDGWRQEEEMIKEAEYLKSFFPVNY